MPKKKDGMLEALQKSLISGFTTAKRFTYFSGLKYISSKRFLDSLCKGENPRLRRFKEGSSYHYVPIKKAKDQ